MSWKKSALIAVWTIAALVWVGVGAFSFTEPSTTGWFLAFGAGVVAVEAAIWTTLAILGLTMIEFRHRAWTTIKQIASGQKAS